MPRNRFLLRLPSRCPQCNAHGTVQLHTIIKGENVHLSWECSACEGEWPIAEGEPRFVERRIGTGERRRVSRGDRRRTKSG